MNKKGINVVIWVFQIILGALFVFAGSMKLAGAQQMVQEFRHWGYTDGFRLLIGTLEVVGGVGLLIPKVSALAASGLGVIMLGAVYTHFANSEGIGAAAPAILFLILLGVIAFVRGIRGRSHPFKVLHPLSSFLILVWVFGLPGCSKTANSAATPPVPEVAIVTVESHDLPATFDYVGQIAGIREVEIRPRVSGILEHWNYKEGSTVQAGQSLFSIDSAPFAAALARSEADLAGAEASLFQASHNASRLKPLWEAKAVSQKDYDDAISSEEVAAAKMKSAQAAVTEAKLNLSYTRVEAPISGITSRALKSEGSLVQAQQTLLTSISQIDPIHVIFSFSEAEHLKFTHAVQEGRLKLPRDGRFDVKLKLADGSEFSGTGKVDFTDVRVDPTTGTIEARAVIPNPQHLLRPGQFAKVQLSGAIRPGAIAIPQRSVLEGPDTKIVMTVNAKGIVEPRPVQVGDWTGKEWVITSGLNPGDRVIVDGFFKAPPGSPVRTTQASSNSMNMSQPADKPNKAN